MPHVVVKLTAGRTDQQKEALAKAITAAVVQSLGSTEAAVSVGIEDVVEDDWTDAVYRPDILAKADTIFKKPGYGPAAQS